MVAIAGADAHSRLPLTRSRTLRFPSYESLFSLERNHLLLERPLSGGAAADRAAILDAIRGGRFYMGLDGLAPADAFGFTVESEGGGRWTMGEQAPLGAGLRAKAGGRVPAGTRLVLLRDGRPLAEASGGLDVPLPGAGVYRVEARVPGWPVPWVITNPIYVFDEAQRERRRAAGAWPAPIVPRAVVPLHELPGTPTFKPEFDPSSRVDPAVDARGLGPGGTDALQLAFRLGVPSPSQPFTWCALVNRQPRDLAPYTGLRFRIKGDGEYRLWVQVRDVNPASADEGLEWWLASARTSTRLARGAAAVLALPDDQQEDRRPPRSRPRRARSCSCSTARPSSRGREGKIWIAGLGVYR